MSEPLSLWLFQGDTATLFWSSDQLDAVNLLFNMDLNPSLSPDEFARVFRAHIQFFLNPQGRIDAEGRGILLDAMLAPWAHLIAALRAEVAGLPAMD
jgi:hypothetical protein